MTFITFSIYHQFTMNEMSTQVVFLLLIQLMGGSMATFQRWLPDTNFENPANWNVKRAPCGNDVVIILDESPVVYMQLNTTIKELVLPMTGEVILGRNVNLGFTENASPNCPSASGDVEFTATHPKSWMNPGSWCATPTEQGTCDFTTPKLDVEKVPCVFDDVIMPRYHSYYIDLSEKVPQLTVKSLKIGGSSFTTSSFSNYLSNDDGRQMFKTSSQPSSSTQLTITRKACDDKRGCACGNDQPQIAKTICRHVVKTCKRPRCQKTIQPVGSCCRMCGAVFNVTRGYGYDHESFTNLIKTNFITDQVTKDVNMSVFVTSEGWIEIVLNDLTGEKSANLARKIKNDMEEDLSTGGHKYAIDGIQLMLSMGSSIGPPSAHSGKSLTGKSVAGIVIAVIIILIIFGILTVYFVFKRTGREMPSISMPSLPRLPRRIQRSMQRSTAHVPSQPHTAAHVDPGFANPLYDSSPFDDKHPVVKEMELMSTTQVEQPTFGVSAGGGFNNPLYESQRAAMFDDPTKVAGATAEKEDTPATGAAKQTAEVPTAATSAKMILIDINEEDESSTI